MRVGRSTSVTGPYTDQDGASLLTPTSGGTLFMGLDFAANHTGTETAADPRPHRGSIGRELGPGHIGIATPADGIERITYHYYDTATANGEPTLGLKTLVWGADGWPRPGWAPSDGTYALGTALNTQPESPALWLTHETETPTLEHY